MTITKRRTQITEVKAQLYDLIQERERLKIERLRINGQLALSWEQTQSLSDLLFKLENPETHTEPITSEPV